MSGIADRSIVRSEPLTRSSSRGAPSEVESSSFWSLQLQNLLSSLATSADGLTTAEAERRLAVHGSNTIGASANGHIVRLLLRQFASPIVLLLIGAACLSVALHDPTDGAIILAIVLVSGLLGFWQEHNAANIVEALLSKVELQATVIRDGRETKVPMTAVVPGDIVSVSAGSGIPADCRILASRDLFVNRVRPLPCVVPRRESDDSSQPTRPLPGANACVHWARTPSRHGAASWSDQARLRNSVGSPARLHLTTRPNSSAGCAASVLPDGGDG